MSSAVPEVAWFNSFVTGLPDCCKPEIKSRFDLLGIIYRPLPPL